VIDFPTDNGNAVYRGSIGDLNVQQMIQQADAAYSDTDGSCTEQLITNVVGYGQALGGEVFYCDGDMTMNSELQFVNGIGTQLGSGTIVINGDLTINANSFYIDSNLANSYNLASVAWIVTGNININPTVTRLAGNYLVLGETSNGATFTTGQDSNLPLEISGLIMARQFDFGRENVGTTSQAAAAEKIIYDGRILANTPPGLGDLSKILPTFFSPQS
jgi:hypothetical protein